MLADQLNQSVRLHGLPPHFLNAILALNSGSDIRVVDRPPVRQNRKAAAIHA